MKKNLLAVLLPVVAGVALSGTGFGLWVFNENVTSKSIGASMELQPAINIQNTMTVDLKVTNSVTNPEFSDSTEVSKMIFDEEYKTTGSWTVTLTVKITYEQLVGELAKYESNSYDYENPAFSADSTELSKKLAHYKITVTNAISTSLANYVTLKTPSVSSLTYTLEKFDSVTSSNIVTLSKDYVFTFVPTSSYNNISTKADYEGLKGAVNGGSITFDAAFALVTA